MNQRAAVGVEVIHEQEWTIAVLVRNGRSPAAEFIDALAVRDRKRLEGLLRRVAAAGPPVNIQKNRQLDRDIWELKSFQQRLLYFRDGPRRMVITHGFSKKQQKLPPVELERARRLHAEYRWWREGGHTT